jgi:hypothetical protein
MTSTLKITVAAVAATCLASSTFAAKSPRSQPIPQHGFQKITRPAVSGSIAAAIGNPAKFAGCDNWITSNYEADDFTTNTFWCDFETFTPVLSYYTTKLKPIKVAIKIKNQAGAVVFQDQGVIDITEGDLGVVEYVADYNAVPPQPAGFYKVIGKLTQGTKVVGQSYWIQVSDRDLDFDCAAVCAGYGVNGDPCTTNDECCLFNCRADNTCE